MMRKDPLRYVILWITLGLVVVACSSDSSSDTTMAVDMDMNAEHTEEYEFGDPMEASSVSRVTEITANDDFAFSSPSGATITKGETLDSQYGEPAPQHG